mgnify:CR=1 FL=1
MHRITLWHRQLAVGLIRISGVALIALCAAFPVYAQGGESGDIPEDGDGDGGYYTPMPCPSAIRGVVGLSYKGLAWGGSWDKTQNTNLVHIAWYRQTEDPYVSVTRKWEWLNAEAKFSCNYFVIIPGLLVVDDFKIMEGRGEVVPYGSEEELQSEEVYQSGGGPEYGGDDEEWYLCWYYRYVDGSRSPYFRCERMQ